MVALFMLEVLRAYWDIGNCGPDGSDHNRGWCGHTSANCPQEVSTTECDSGLATKIMFKLEYTLGDCHFKYYAEYVCKGYR